jgi:ApeA N-terminal domain 1
MTRRVSLVEAHEFRGFWWLPADEEKKLTGTLAINDGASALDVVGDFGHRLLSETSREKTYSLDPAEQTRIVGISTDGREITLDGFIAAPGMISMPGIPTATYRHDFALIGKQFDEDEEIGFDEIAIRASDLNTWTLVSGFQNQMRLEKNEEKGFSSFTGVDIRYEAPDDIDIPLARGERAFIRFAATSKGITGRGTDISLKQEAAFHLRFRRRCDLRTVLGRVSQVRNFLSLAVGRPVTVFSVSGYRDDFVYEQLGASRPIELVWQLPRNPEPPAKRREPHEMLFTLREAAPSISSVLKHWFAKQERMSPVLDLFFGVRHHPGLTLEVTFLSYAQALETYDYRRRRKPGKLSLAERMASVLGQCRSVSKRIVGSDPDAESALIDDFKNSRNYYTHYNPKREKKAAKGANLYLLTIQLQALLEMSLLRQLGFGCRAIEATLERSRRLTEIESVKRTLAADAT